ncbi:MAG: acyl carrier protein [Sphingopyxis sp.]|nr:acyl carrier protein [Sphingopyxis sp.]
MNELYVGLAEIFEIEPEEISAATVLEEHAWDSLAMVSLIALFDELYGKEVNIDALKKCETVADIEKLAAA